MDLSRQVLNEIADINPDDYKIESGGRRFNKDLLDNFIRKKSEATREDLNSYAFARGELSEEREEKAKKEIKQKREHSLRVFFKETKYVSFDRIFNILREKVQEYFDNNPNVPVYLFFSLDKNEVSNWCVYLVADILKPYIENGTIKGVFHKDTYEEILENDSGDINVLYIVDMLLNPEKINEHLTPIFSEVPDRIFNLIVITAIYNKGHLRFVKDYDDQDIIVYSKHTVVDLSDRKYDITNMEVFKGFSSYVTPNYIDMVYSDYDNFYGYKDEQVTFIYSDLINAPFDNSGIEKIQI